MLRLLTNATVKELLQAQVTAKQRNCTTVIGGS